MKISLNNGSFHSFRHLIILIPALLLMLGFARSAKADNPVACPDVDGHPVKCFRYTITFTKTEGNRTSTKNVIHYTYSANADQIEADSDPYRPQCGPKIVSAYGAVMKVVRSGDGTLICEDTLSRSKE